MKQVKPEPLAGNEMKEEESLSEHIINEEDSSKEELKNVSTRLAAENNSRPEKFEGSDTVQKNDIPDEKTVLEEQEVLYTSFSKWEKRLLVLIATFATFFSPFTTQIYFPAINTIAEDLHVTSSQVNLTVTTYMILQAIAPAFVGGFSDTAGRRPAYIICFTIYIISNIALALQNNYVALLILRMVQSAGGSGTVALANAVVADIATSAERGIYVGYASMMAGFAPAVGPILGGIISQYTSWKWIFGFLAIFSMIFFIPLLLFMPETCRKIVGDGSIPPPKWSRSLTNFRKEHKLLKQGITPDYSKRDELAAARKLRFPNPLATLRIVSEKEATLLLFYAGIVYAGFYAIISGMPFQFHDIYGFDDLKVGLMYLPISGGCFLAAFTQGKIIDWSYFREARRLGITVVKSRQQDLSHFPIEKARLQVGFPMILLASLSTITYGWIMHFRVNIAGPCVILVVLGYTLIASTQAVSILIVDVNPEAAGSATAAFNLVRCLLGAGSTALIVPMVDKMGLGWSYTFIALLYVVLSPMLFAVMKLGPGWRRERAEKQRIGEERKKDDEAVRDGQA
ncbi:uncharacterized protein EAE97_004178 [Botrytis byssoidea]|uniref:Major facilitator superfamily (MFS) profile domain-containing protein n=1 Tax=Botrytis byssoidea TaxID=139641 RepID=A0A9P5IM50_9HELO|nr:uncharacterized protein EAE97_004178 [Botrytis byssoidea]KAF7946929.1 hypothetical protein EAE97_004178 [Botrytis byssoidea]